MHLVHNHGDVPLAEQLRISNRELKLEEMLNSYVSYTAAVHLQ